MKTLFLIRKSHAIKNYWYVMTVTGPFIFVYESSFKDAIARMDIIADKIEMSA